MKTVFTRFLSLADLAGSSLASERGEKKEVIELIGAGKMILTRCILVCADDCNPEIILLNNVVNTAESRLNFDIH